VRGAEARGLALLAGGRRRAGSPKAPAKTTLFLAKWLTLAFLLESLMLAYVPAEWVAGALGGDGHLADR
jgi:uncharacterized protein